MSCDNELSFGVYLPSVQGGDPRKLALPSEIKVLFHELSPRESKLSNVFPVREKEIAVIETYNMPSGYHIYTNRVIWSSPIPITGPMCGTDNACKQMRQEGEVLFRERMTLGYAGLENWSLYRPSTGCTKNPRLQLIIAVPGVYELELEDESMLGDLLVTYTIFNKELTSPLPFDYYAGMGYPCPEGQA